MDIFSRDDLEQLASAHGEHCLSIYMPTHQATEAVQQAPTRLKNLITEAEGLLAEAGLRAPDGRDFLQPVRRILADEVFWQHQSDGLAIFVCEDAALTYRLPLSFDDLVVLTDRFHIKPLFPLLSGDGRFYILALHQQGARLFEATKHRLSEVDLASLPESVSETLQYDPEAHFQFHTSTRTPSAGSAPSSSPAGQNAAGAGSVQGGRPAVFHGQGGTEAGYDEEELRLYCRRIDEAVTQLLAGGQAPLVLAGIEYLLSIYQDANTYPHLVEDQGVLGAIADIGGPEGLHERAWDIMQPLFAAEREAAIERYEQLAGQGARTASASLEEVALAAPRGRVEILFVPLERRKWGVVEPDDSRVTIYAERQAGAEDLFDFSAVHTLLNSGQVYAVGPADMPGDAPLAAIFRY